MNFADRVTEAARRKQSVAVLGVDPQLESAGMPALPAGYTLLRFCCEIIEACAPSVVAVKPQLACFEARGLDGMRALAEVVALARKLGLVTIADAKRGDIGPSSAAYAEAFLGAGDFGCDAVTVNPYPGSDAIAPFLERVRSGGRGLFVLVKTSNPSAGEFQDLDASGRPLWQSVAERVRAWGEDFVGKCGLSPVGAVVGATYPEHGRRARHLMPKALILAPGYGAQGASAEEAASAARSDGSGILVNASRTLMYAYRSSPGLNPGEAAAGAAETMRLALNRALSARK